MPHHDIYLIFAIKFLEDRLCLSNILNTIIWCRIYLGEGSVPGLLRGKFLPQLSCLCLLVIDMRAEMSYWLSDYSVLF